MRKGEHNRIKSRLDVFLVQLESMRLHQENWGHLIGERPGGRGQLSGSDSVDEQLDMTDCRFSAPGTDLTLSYSWVGQKVHVVFP